MQESRKFASHSVFLGKLLEDILYQLGDTKKEDVLKSWYRLSNTREREMEFREDRKSTLWGKSCTTGLENEPSR